MTIMHATKDSETIQAVQLCVSGIPEETQPHSELDSLYRKAELRRLTADDERVIAAARVCHECVFDDECTDKMQEHFAGNDVDLPRPIARAGMFGRAFYLEVDSPSLEILDLQEAGVAASSLARAREAFGSERNPNFGNDVLKKTVYDFVVHNKMPEDFAEFLRSLRSTIDKEEKEPRPKKAKSLPPAEQQKHKSQTLLRAMSAIDVDILPSDYSSNAEQGERNDLFCKFMNGKVSVSALTGNPDDDYEPIDPAIAKNLAIVDADLTAATTLGTCVPFEANLLMQPSRGMNTIKAQATCLKCPVFAECGVARVLTQDSAFGRINIGLRPQQQNVLRSKIFRPALKRSLLQEDFADKHKKFLELLRGLQQGLTRDDIKMPLGHPRTKVSLQSRLVSLSFELEKVVKEPTASKNLDSNASEQVD